MGTGQAWGYTDPRARMGDLPPQAANPHPRHAQPTPAVAVVNFQGACMRIAAMGRAIGTLQGMSGGAQCWLPHHLLRLCNGVK